MAKDRGRLIGRGAAPVALLIGLLAAVPGTARAQGLDPTALEAMRQQLEAQVGTLGSEIVSLRDALGRAQAEAAQKASALAASAAEAASRLDLAGRQVAERDAKLTMISAEVSDRDAKLALTAKEIAERDSRLALIANEIAARDARLASTAKDIADREVRLAQVSTEVADRDAKLAAAEKELAARASQLAAYQKEAVALLADRDGKLAAADGKLAAADKELAARASQLEAYQKEAAALLADRDGKIAAALKEVAARDTRLDDAAYEMEAQRTAREGTAKTLADRETRLAAATASVEKLEKQVVDLTKARDAALADIKAKTATFEQTLAGAAGARTRLTADLNAAKAVAAKGEADLAAVSTKLEQQRLLLVAAEAAIVERRAEAAKFAALSEAKDVELGSVAKAMATGAELRGALPTALRTAFARQPAVRRVGDRTAIPADLLFGFGRTKLSPEGEKSAKDMAAAIMQATAGLPTDSPWVVLLTAHSDSTRLKKGSAYDTNREVSLERALNLAEALTAAGVPPQRLVAAGVGSEQPLVPGEDGVAKALNRRVELELVAR